MGKINQTDNSALLLYDFQFFISISLGGEDHDAPGAELTAAANSEWLLKRLPRLPCFAGYYPQISNALRFACQYENDPLGNMPFNFSNL